MRRGRAKSTEAIIAQIVLDLIDSANVALRKAVDYIDNDKRGTAARYCLIAKQNLVDARQDIQTTGERWRIRLTTEADRTEKILWRVSRDVLLRPNADGYFTCELRKSFLIQSVAPSKGTAEAVGQG